MQAGRERARALASALAGGVPVRPLAGAWLVRKVQFATMNMLSNSGNRLLVFGCERSVSGSRDPRPCPDAWPEQPEQHCPGLHRGLGQRFDGIVGVSTPTGSDPYFVMVTSPL